MYVPGIKQTCFIFFWGGGGKFNWRQAKSGHCLNSISMPRDHRHTEERMTLTAVQLWYVVCWLPTVSVVAPTMRKCLISSHITVPHFRQLAMAQFLIRGAINYNRSGYIQYVHSTGMPSANQGNVHI